MGVRKKERILEVGEESMKQHLEESFSRINGLEKCRRNSR